MNSQLLGFAAVAVWAGLLVASAGAQLQSTDGEPATVVNQAGSDDPWSAIEPEFPSEERRMLRRRPTEGMAPVLTKKGDEPKRPWLRTLGALAGVVGLIVLLSWGYRAMSGGNLPLLGKARRPGVIEIVSRTSLSARQSLCLVRIGSRLVLIGQSQDNLCSLDVIDDADLSAKLAGEAAGAKLDSSRAEFRGCLEREATGYQPDGEEANESVAPDARRISDVQQCVTDTLQRVRRAVARA